MTVIAATDLSPDSESALLQAAQLAYMLGEDLLCVHVIEDIAEYSGWLMLVESPGELVEALKVKLQAQLEAFCKEALYKLPAGQRPNLELKVLDGHVVDQLTALAKAHGSNTIIACGSEGHSALMAGLIGSTPHGLIKEGESSLLITPAQQPLRPIKHILVPVDLASPDHAELEAAKTLALRFDAKLSLLYCIQWPSPIIDPLYAPSLDHTFRDKVRRQRQEQLQRLADEAQLGEHLAQLLLVEGKAATTINEAAAEHQVDLISISTHARRGIRRFVLGNTAERILRHLTCPAFISPID